MSWEDQGRQFHQWFGHGTVDNVQGAGPDGGQNRDVAGAVGAAAIGALGAAHGHSLARALANGGSRSLSAALPLWAAGAGMAPDRFRALMVGPGFSAAGAASLQALGRVVAGAEDGGLQDADVQAAGAHLAVALGGERASDWGYKLKYASAKAAYAAAHGLMPPAQNTKATMSVDRTNTVSDQGHPEVTQKAQYAIPGMPLPLPISPQMVPGSPENERLARETIRDLGRILQMLRDGLTAPSLSSDILMSPFLPLVTRMHPPADAKDPDGAKAPGKPGAEEGFEDPKGGEEWVRAPKGSKPGWLDKDGNVWIPTGQGSSAHGGPHWDIQDKNGDFVGSMYPGGRLRS